MTSVPDRIQKQILLRAPLARVWRAISNSDEFGSWFGMRLKGPFRPGTKVEGVIIPTRVDAAVAEKQKPFEGAPVELAVERVEPERLLAFRWHPYEIDDGTDLASAPTTLVEFELADHDGGVLLTITESGFDRVPLDRRAKAFSGNEEGWAMQVKLIEKYLAEAA